MSFVTLPAGGQPGSVARPATKIMALDSGLLGHWPLRGDGRDVCGAAQDGKPEHVDFSAPGRDGQPGGAAGFDGRASSLTVRASDALRLGTGSFSLAAWVHTAQALDDVLGDIVCKYDADTRHGFALGLLNYAGVTSAQPNYRNLHFGIDGGTDRLEWIDSGRPGNAVMVKALAVHDGTLYAGTFETRQHEAGHVYRYAGGKDWEDCGAPDRCNSVTSLAVHAGALFAGVSRYQASGSALPDSPNRHPGGRVYRYAGGREWTECGKLDEGDRIARAGAAQRASPYRSPVADSVAGLAVYQDHLYATPLYSEGVFRYDGGTRWAFCGSPGRRLMALVVYDGFLFGAGNEGGGLFRYDGRTAWSACGFPAGASQVYSFAIYQGRLHAGTWPDGAVFRWEGGDQWTHCGRLGEELEVMGMAVYNGKLYAGTLPLAQVYRYDGPGPMNARGVETTAGTRGAGAADSGHSDASWTLTGQLDRTPDVRYRRAWSMAVYQGKLFCGTLPSGHVYSLEAGQNVTYDRELAPGWRHLVATRDGARLRLYIDGQFAAETASPARMALDVANDVPLQIGFGQHDHFCGRLADVRLYDRALEAAEAAALAATP